MFIMRPYIDFLISPWLNSLERRHNKIELNVSNLSCMINRVFRLPMVICLAAGLAFLCATGGVVSGVAVTGVKVAVANPIPIEVLLFLTIELCVIVVALTFLVIHESKR